MPRQIVNIQDKLLEDNFENSKDKRKMVNKLCELERKYSNAFSMRMQTRKRLDNWIRIYNREIVDTYIHDRNDVPGTCIILEGSDNGTLWFKDEKKVL